MKKKSKDKPKYQLKLVCVVDRQQFYLSKYGGITLDSHKAFSTYNLNKLNPYIKRYNKTFKLIVIEKETGEVIEVYEKIHNLFS